MINEKNYFYNILEKNNQILWVFLAFHAGYINAGGFLASQRFVSHLTGIGTSIGVTISEGDYLIALELVFAPISFILGAAYSGYLVDRKIIHEREPAIYRGVFTVIFFNLFVLICGVQGFFGEFGEPLRLQRDFLLLFILTFVCGLQNGLFVSLTSGQIRTTHLTGLFTDFGLSLVRTIFMKSSEVRIAEKRRNRLRFMTILSFSIGSLISALIFKLQGYWGFLGSFFISIVILILVYRIKRKFGASL